LGIPDLGVLGINDNDHPPHQLAYMAPHKSTVKNIWGAVKQKGKHSQQMQASLLCVLNMLFYGERHFRESGDAVLTSQQHQPAANSPCWVQRLGFNCLGSTAWVQRFNCLQGFNCLGSTAWVELFNCLQGFNCPGSTAGVQSGDLCLTSTCDQWENGKPISSIDTGRATIEHGAKTNSDLQ
jgi:hypothetical protein